ncbi:ABC transporter ATP-binding protein [uncultured Corynebacterium sp.]|uniref:ABC transporter ATP-binding protein n=1 Tax=uncultured Corynebacterium sp. TaxID=159447 RepID=UPI0025DC48C1|nr:ABC transporter ATP-binding protein [uncultured Corynebacterium sp.]
MTSPTQNPDRLPVATGKRTLAVLWQRLRGHRGVLVFSAVISTVAVVFDLVTPAVLGAVVDDVSGRADGHPAEHSLWTYALLIAVAGIAGAVLSVYGVLLAARMMERLLAGLREELITTALRLPQQQVERSGTGDLISRASDDVAQVSTALSQVLPSLTRTVFTIVVTVVGVSVLDWRFGLIILVALPLYWWILRWYLRLAPPMYAAERAAFGARAHELLSALNGVDTVLAFGRSDWHSRRIAAASWAAAAWALRARTVMTMFRTRIDLVFLFIVAGVIVAGFFLVDASVVTVGVTTSAMLFFLRLEGPLTILMMQFDTLQSATASLARIVGVIDADPGTGTRIASAGVATGAASSAVSLDGVGFSYDPGRPVLHGVDLRVSPGEHVAVVGTSGAGKTTLAALVAGIHPVGSGTVTAPEKTALVAQETHVFATTLRENLTLVAPAASDAELTEALSATGASGLLDDLPDGLDTLLGIPGFPLTAAQQQHLALTRLLLADPDLAILDEATAEAGSAHARVLDHAAEVALADRTGLVIAHRLSQAAACDRIVVMEHGRVVELGSHGELLAAEGRYAELWAAWSS